MSGLFLLVLDGACSSVWIGESGFLAHRMGLVTAVKHETYSKRDRKGSERVKPMSTLKNIE